MSDLLNLAERCEAATGPDRRLDALIWFRAIERIAPGEQPLDKDMIGRWPTYTASIDAAMTLVPEGHFWWLGMRGEKRGGFHACCVIGGPLVWIESATPALALCAASLRALDQSRLPLSQGEG